MSAMDACRNAYAAYLRSEPQLFLEVDDLTQSSAPDSDDGSADAHQAILQSQGVNPGPDMIPASDGAVNPTAESSARGGVPAFCKARVDSEAGHRLVGGTNDASPVVASRTVTIPDGASPDQHQPSNQTADGCSPSRASAAVGMEVTL